MEEARLAVTKVNERLEDLVKERTNELFMSREHFKFLADHIPVIVWTPGPMVQLIILTISGTSIPGLPAESRSMEVARSVVFPDDLPLAIDAWEKATKKQDKFEYEYG